MIFASLIFWVLILGIAVTLADDPFVFRFFIKPTKTRSETKLEKYNEVILQKYFMNKKGVKDGPQNDRYESPQKSSEDFLVPIVNKGKDQKRIEDEDFLDGFFKRRDYEYGEKTFNLI